MRNTWAIALHGGAADSWIGDDNSHENLCIFLQEILKTAETALAGGASAITVVTEVVASLEDYPDINAGRGSALNIDGIHELEAGIVDGSTSKYRAVTGLQRTKNPIRLASTLMRRPVPCLIFGTTADDMAAEEGLVIVDNDYFTTDRRRTYWEANISRVRAIIEDHGTAGAVAIDINGDLAAANTTGGLTFKLSGRLGDTAIVGAGIWADRNVAIVCSGSGEAILQTTTAGKIAAYYSAGSSLDDAVRTAILQTGDAFPKSSCGCIAISSEGEISIQSNSRLFTTAAATSQSGTRTANVLAPSILALKHHMFYTDTLMQAGFCKYPTRKYQIIAEVKPNRKGNTFNFVLFERFFLTIRRLASEIQATLGCTGFKFITEGPTKVFLSPFRMITTNNPALSDAEVESHRSWEQCPDGATSSGRTENRAHLCEMKASTTALSLKCFEEELDDNFCLKIWTVRESEGSKLDRAEIHEKHNCSTRDFFNLDPRRFHNVIAAIWSALKILTKRFDTHTDSIAFQSPCVSSAIVIEIRPLETILQHFPSPAPYCGNSQDAPSIECGVIAPDFEELGSLAAVTRERLYDRCTRGNDDCDGSSQNVAVSHTFLAQSRKSQLHQLCFHEIHGFFGINLGYQVCDKLFTALSPGVRLWQADAHVLHLPCPIHEGLYTISFSNERSNGPKIGLLDNLTVSLLLAGNMEDGKRLTQQFIARLKKMILYYKVRDTMPSLTCFFHRLSSFDPSRMAWKQEEAWQSSDASCAQCFTPQDKLLGTVKVWPRGLNVEQSDGNYLLATSDVIDPSNSDGPAVAGLELNIGVFLETLWE